MRGIVAPILGLCAVACCVFGVLNATIWRPSTDIAATARLSGARYVVTDPGVLDLVDTSARMRVSSDSSSQTVCIALASAQDAMGWVAGETVTRVTGMSNWSTLSTDKYEAAAGADSQGSDVDFKDSDMWTASRCGQGSVGLVTSDTSSTVAVIDLGKASTGGSLVLSWTRRNPPNFAAPLYFMAVLFAGMAFLSASVFAISPERRRKSVKAAAAAGKSAGAQEEVTIREALKGTLEVIHSSMPRGRSRRAGASGRGASHKRREASRKRLDDGQKRDSGDHAEAGPVVVDPSARSMVAEQESRRSASDETRANDGVREDRSGVVGDDVEQTSVISSEELRSYFARLAQESARAGDQTDDHADHDDESPHHGHVPGSQEDRG